MDTPLSKKGPLSHAVMSEGGSVVTAISFDVKW